MPSLGGEGGEGAGGADGAPMRQYPSALQCFDVQDNTDFEPAHAVLNLADATVIHILEAEDAAPMLPRGERGGVKECLRIEADLPRPADADIARRSVAARASRRKSSSSPSSNGPATTVVRRGAGAGGGFFGGAGACSRACACAFAGAGVPEGVSKVVASMS